MCFWLLSLVLLRAVGIQNLSNGRDAFSHRGMHKYDLGGDVLALVELLLVLDQNLRLAVVRVLVLVLVLVVVAVACVSSGWGDCSGRYVLVV